MNRVGTAQHSPGLALKYRRVVNPGGVVRPAVPGIHQGADPAKATAIFRESLDTHESRPMKRKHQWLLVIDGIVNLAIGLILLSFPAGMDKVLGLPQSETTFYPVILGAVIFGIGIALFVEWVGASGNIRGLGLGGAIVINICGGWRFCCFCCRGRCRFRFEASFSFGS